MQDRTLGVFQVSNKLLLHLLFLLRVTTKIEVTQQANKSRHTRTSRLAQQWMVDFTEGKVLLTIRRVK